MLLLIFDKELQASPVKQDWSLQTRSDLAGMLCRTLRQTAGTTLHKSVIAPPPTCPLGSSWFTTLWCSRYNRSRTRLNIAMLCVKAHYANYFLKVSVPCICQGDTISIKQIACIVVSSTPTCPAPPIMVGFHPTHDSATCILGNSLGALSGCLTSQREHIC